MLNRYIVLAGLAVYLFGAEIGSNAHAAPFQTGDFVTYSQDSWGAKGTAASVVLENNFFTVYISGAVEIGLPGNLGNSAFFTSQDVIFDYLPTAGTPAPLDNDLVDPTSTPSGIFGGYVLALQLNVDFADAGLLSGSGASFGDLIIFNLTAFPDLSGLSVRQFLASGNTCLGGGPCLLTWDDMASVANDLSLAFESGIPTQFAQDHLRIAAQPVPEPGTLSLLVIGIAVLTLCFGRNVRTLQRQPS
jgi:hypothetical protein